MTIRSNVNVEITVNGSGFDNPLELAISKNNDIPTCDLTFKDTSCKNRLLQTDIVRVFIGVGELPTNPQFTGVVVEEPPTGTRRSLLKLSGLQSIAMGTQVTITDYDNYDGFEMSQAIYHAFRRVTGLNSYNLIMKATNPVVTVPVNTRFKNGVSVWNLIKQFRDMSIDSQQAIRLGRYVLFEHGDYIQFRKVPNPLTASPCVTLAYGDTLIGVDPANSSTQKINGIKVVGKDGLEGSYTNTHRIAVDGKHDGETIVNENILSVADAFEIARSYTLAHLQDPVGLQIRSPLLLDCIPNYSVVEITGAPMGISDKYLLSQLDIAVSTSKFAVVGNVKSPNDVVAESLMKILGIQPTLLEA